MHDNHYINRWLEKHKIVVYNHSKDVNWNPDGGYVFYKMTYPQNGHALSFSCREANWPRKEIFFAGRKWTYLTHFLIDKVIKREFPSARWYFGVSGSVILCFDEEDAFRILLWVKMC